MYRGHTYRRSTSELRQYKAAGPPLQLPSANDSKLYVNNLAKDKFVALCDTNDPTDNKFSIAKVIDVDADTDMATLAYYGTTMGNINTAKWRPLIKWERAVDGQMQHTYKLSHVPSVRFRPVHTTIPMDDPAKDFSRVRHCDVEMLASGKIAKKSRVQLTEMGLVHHQLGKTFS